jgi:hypothetical protein
MQRLQALSCMQLAATVGVGSADAVVGTHQLCWTSAMQQQAHTQPMALLSLHTISAEPLWVQAAALIAGSCSRDAASIAATALQHLTLKVLRAYAVHVVAGS